MNRGLMKTWKKVCLIVAGLVLIGAIVGVSYYKSHEGIVEVQTGKASRQELASVVTASGEIRPKTFVNVGANAMGKIIKLYVKEGDKVVKGQMLAQLENIQAGADVNATQASLTAAEADYTAGPGDLEHQRRRSRPRQGRSGAEAVSLEAQARVSTTTSSSRKKISTPPRTLTRPPSAGVSPGQDAHCPVPAPRPRPSSAASPCRRPPSCISADVLQQDRVPRAL